MWLTRRSPAASPGEDCSGSSADLLFAAATAEAQEAAAAAEDDGQDQWQCGHAKAARCHGHQDLGKRRKSSSSRNANDPSG